MRRAFRILAALAVLIGLWSHLHAQVPMTGAGLPKPTAVSSTTTFDSANKGSNITLSGGNLTATSGASSTANTAVLSVASHSSGKYYLEFKLTTLTSGNDGFGVANSSFLVASDEMGFNTANRSAAFYNDGSNGHIFLASSSHNGTGTTTTANDWIAMAIDRTAQLMWVKNLTAGGDWNASVLNDPATGVGGQDISALGAGAYFFGTQLEISGDAVTVNAGGTAYVGSVPIGYSNW